MNKTLYKHLKEIFVYSAWYMQPFSYREDNAKIQFTLCLKNLKIEVVLNKDSMDLDIKKMLKAIDVKDRGN